ncbi:hypothetical protein [Limnohabitans sp.]
MFNNVEIPIMETHQTAQHLALRLDRPVSDIVPRALREGDAAAYIGFSPSYLRNQRVSDVRALRRGEGIKGPRWVTIATAIRYLREDLDEWLNASRVDPGQGDPGPIGDAA